MIWPWPERFRPKHVVSSCMTATAEKSCTNDSGFLSTKMCSVYIACGCLCLKGHYKWNNGATFKSKFWWWQFCSEERVQIKRRIIGCHTFLISTWHRSHGRQVVASFHTSSSAYKVPRTTHDKFILHNCIIIFKIPKRHDRAHNTELYKCNRPFFS